MINLNDSKYSQKKLVTEENIFNIISDYDVFMHYIENFSLSSLIKSPLRAQDKDPSFNVFYSKKAQRLLYKDFGESGDSGSCVKFVGITKNIGYRESLEDIIVNFNLQDQFVIDKSIQNKQNKIPIIHDKSLINNTIKKSKTIRVKTRPWNNRDKIYWNSFGISLLTLAKYGVSPIKYLFINEDVFTVDNYAYAYKEFKDSQLRYKIYQPFSSDYKWINNLIEGTISGWANLSEYGDILCIASSLKDGMCIHDLGFSNILAPQTENYIFKPHIVKDLQKRFKTIIVFYDYDNAGISASMKMSKLYGFIPFYTYDAENKDPSDFYRAKNKNKLIKTIRKNVFNELRYRL